MVSVLVRIWRAFLPLGHPRRTHPDFQKTTKKAATEKPGLKEASSGLGHKCTVQSSLRDALPGPLPKISVLERLSHSHHHATQAQRNIPKHPKT